MLRRFLFILLFLFSLSSVFAAENKKEFKKTGKIINTVYETNKRISSAFTENDTSCGLSKSNNDNLQERQKEVKKFYESFNRKVVAPKEDKRKPQKVKAEQIKKTNDKDAKARKNITDMSRSIYLKNKERSYEEIVETFEPYGLEVFAFGNHPLQRNSVYVVYSKKMLYFLIGGRVYGPKLSSEGKGYINKWMSPKEFTKYANKNDYSAYNVGRFNLLQMKRFHIFWLANYNDKKLAEISTNACYYTDILNKLNNYQVKFYTLEQEKRNYFDVRKIMEEKESLFPPIEETFEGKFEQIDD